MFNYGYIDEYIPLTIESIFERITQEEIFSMLLGELPAINKSYLSLVRIDKEGTCFFSYYNSKLYFVDYGNSVTHMDCFGVIQQKFRITFQQALSSVNNHFKLGLDGDGEPVKIKYSPIKVTRTTKQEIDILFRTRPFNITDKNYWNPYGISKHDLEEDFVFALLWYKFYSTRRRKEIIVRPKFPTYAYTEFRPKVKIYSPYRPKNQGKWITNVNQNHIGNINNLPISGEKLVITKAYKDSRVLRNLGITCVWFQNEGVLPSSQHIIMLGNRFDEIIVLYDNDKPGLNAAKIVVSYINSHFPGKARSTSIPLMNKIKDSSDLYFYKGKYELLSFLIKTNII